MEAAQFDPNLPTLALVTGAARRIGRAIALALCREGYAIGLHYHELSEVANQTASEIRQLGGEAYLLRGDLAVPEQIQGMFQEVERIPRRLGVLVNSASRMARASVLEISAEEWDATLALNLRAPLLCAQEAARRMGRQGGAIINISDAGAHKVWSGYPAYTVSKTGLETLTRLLARSLAPAIRVNAVAPGLILPSEQVSGEEWQRLVQRLPLKQAGTPEGIAGAVVFLLQNEYITGQTLVIDGGYQLVKKRVVHETIFGSLTRAPGAVYPAFPAVLPAGWISAVRFGRGPGALPGESHRLDGLLAGAGLRDHAAAQRALFE